MDEDGRDAAAAAGKARGDTGERSTDRVVDRVHLEHTPGVKTEEPEEEQHRPKANPNNKITINHSETKRCQQYRLGGELKPNGQSCFLRLLHAGLAEGMDQARSPNLATVRGLAYKANKGETPLANSVGS